MGNLSSPFVVSFVDQFWAAHGTLVIVMEYCNGGDLASALEGRRTPFDAEVRVKRFFVL